MACDVKIKGPFIMILLYFLVLNMSVKDTWKDVYNTIGHPETTVFVTTLNQQVNPIIIF